MEGRARNDIRTLIVDPEKFVPELTEQRVRILLMELQQLIEDYERENCIMYLASNYSANKHLSFSAMRGMFDDQIKQMMLETEDYLKGYLGSLKGH